MSLDLYIIPNACPHCGRGDESLSFNITHNLGKMAEACGVYMCLWRPEEIGVKTAEELIEPITTALDMLLADPGRFRKFEPENRWGTYEGFVAFLRELGKACIEHPTARIRASR